MKELRQFVLADLQRGMRLMVKVQDDIDPQVRIATPEGDIAVAVTFPEDRVAREDAFCALQRFCTWKQALAYTMTFNLAHPKALMTVGVSGKGAVGCILRFDGEPGTYCERRFETPVWVTADGIDDVFLTLLPARTAVLSDKDLKELEHWFGADGLFPAIHIATGRSGL